MAIRTYHDCYPVCNSRPSNAGDEGIRLGSWRADADRIGLARDTTIANVDIVTAGREILAGSKAERDVAVAGGVLKERQNPCGRVVAAGCIGVEGVAANRGVFCTDGVIVHRFPTNGRVVEPGGVEKEGLIACRRVVDAACEAKERILTLSGVIAGIASVRWRVNRSDRWR